MGRFLRGHLGRCKWSVAWRDVADVYLAKRPTLVILETVGAGARKSVCFCDLLRWSVVRQGSSDLAMQTLVRGRTQCHRQKRSFRAGRGTSDSNGAQLALMGHRFLERNSATDRFVRVHSGQRMAA